MKSKERKWKVKLIYKQEANRIEIPEMALTIYIGIDIDIWFQVRYDRGCQII